ncbi:RHS repeat-associated core domain-containing protein [Paenibacillus sp. SEL1]
METFYAGLILDFPYNIQRIEKLNFLHKMNEHAVLRFKAIIPDAQSESLQKMSVDDKVSLFKAHPINAEKENPLFRGMIKRAAVKYVQGVHFLEVEAVSFTYQMDLEWKKRSFQNKQKTYGQIVDNLLEDYPGAHCSDETIGNIETGQLLLQYEETDWQFIKRMASHLNTVVISVMSEETPSLLLGIPEGQETGKLENDSYTMQSRFGSTTQMGYEANHTLFSVESRVALRLGAQVDFQHKPYIVCEVAASVVKGELLYTYTLTSRSTIKTNKIMNTAIQGLSLEGRITQISRNQIKLHLDIDATNDDAGTCWFPYSTGMDNQSAYMMPKSGSPVKLHFPTALETGAIAVSSVRRGAEQSKYSQKSSDPVIKSLTNDSDKEMKLTGQDIVFAANSQESIKFQLTGDGKVEILSDTDMCVKATTDFKINLVGELPAPKQIQLTAGELVAISRSPVEGVNPEQVIWIEDKTNAQAATIYYEGEPGKAPAVQYDDSALIAQDKQVMEQVNNNAAAKRQALVNKLEAGKQKVGFGKIAMIIGAVAVGVAVTVLTAGAAAPLVVAAASVTLAAGATTMVVAASESSEGQQDIAKARVGDLSQSYNFMRDTVLGGNQELYDVVKYGAVTVSVAGVAFLTGGASALIVPSIGGGINTGITAIFDPNAHPGETLIGHYMNSFSNGFISATVAGKFMTGVKCGTGALNIYSRLVASGVAAGTVQDVMNTGQTDLKSNLTRSLVGGAFSFAGNNKISSYLSSVVGDMSGSMADDYRKHGNVKESLTVENLKKSLISSIGNLVTRGDPIDVVKGRFYFTATDMVVQDIGQIEMVRSYTSTNSMTGGTGRGFTFTYESSIRRMEDHILVICTDGHYEHFIEQDGQWINEIGGKQDYNLSEDSVTKEYRLTDKERRTYIYDQDGRLLKIKDRSNNETLLEYDVEGLCKLTTPGGKEITFTYSGGKLYSITDNIGRTVKYEYEGDFLTRVTYPNAGVTSYVYDAKGRIDAITDQNGHRYVRNQYDQHDRVIRQWDADDHVTDIEYDEAKRRTTFTYHATGVVENFEYNTDDLVTDTIYSDGTRESFTYDAHQNKSSHTDTMGHTTKWAYNIFGNLAEEIRPDGTRTERQYDQDQNLTQIAVNGVTEKWFTHDAMGRLIEEKTSIADGTHAVISYMYDPQGRILSSTDTLGHTTVYSYGTDHTDAPTQVQDAEGNKYLYTFDDAARMMSITTAYGTVEFEYNHLNKRTRIVDAEGNTTLMFYDKMGNLVKKVLPNDYVARIDNGKGIEYRYDAMDRLVRMTDLAQNVSRTRYDINGNILKEIEPNYYNHVEDDGPGTEYEYDHRGRRIKVRYPDSGIARMKYDANGNMIKMILPEHYDPIMDDGPGTEYVYDVMNRLVQITDAEGHVSRRFVYDHAGRVTKAIDGKGYASETNDSERFGTLYVYNTAGWLIEKREPVEESDQVLYRLTLYRYDQAGNLLEEKRTQEYVSETDYAETYQSVRYSYDRNHRVIAIADDTGAEIHYTYDCLNQKTSERQKLNEQKDRLIRYEYNKTGWLQRHVEVLNANDLTDRVPGLVNAVTSYGYDRNGNVVEIVTPEGYQTEISYDAVDRMVQISRRESTDARTSSVYLKYDRTGNVIEETDTNGSKVTYTYDPVNRRIRMIGKRGGTTRLFYDKTGNIVKQVTPNQYDPAIDDGPGMTFTYDRLNRLIEVANPYGQIMERSRYNEFGELVSKMDGGVGVEYTYTLGGRVKQVMTPAKAGQGIVKQEYIYDAAGNITGIRDGEGHLTRHIVDGWGKITALHKADGSTEHYRYDYAGNIVSSTDGNGQTTQYDYNSLGKLSAILDPDKQKMLYQYDTEGRLARQTDRNGKVIEYAYNFNDQLLKRREMSSGVEESYMYREDGLLQTAANEHTRYDYTYNEDGLLTGKYMSSSGNMSAAFANLMSNNAAEDRGSGHKILAYEYDAEGNPIAQTDAGGRTTEYRYDLVGRVSEIRQDQELLAKYGYVYGNRVASILYGNGIEMAYDYDADGNVSKLQAQSPDGSPLLQHRYEYDNNGHQIARDENGKRTKYRYDAIGQLVEAEYPGWGTERLSYDAVGNRLSRMWNDHKASYTYDSRNRLLSVLEEALGEGSNQEAGSRGQQTRYEYDAQGNLLRERSGQESISYAYDAFNRTVKAEKSDGSYIRHLYDPEGLRNGVEENGTHRRFVYDGWYMVNELDEEARVQASFVRGHEWLARVDEVGNPSYYVNNTHGDVLHLTDRKGRVQNSYAYDAFGNTLSMAEQIENRFRYAGEAWESVTQQYYLRARFYNPAIARFTQEDTYRGDGLNLYAYVGNNPIHYVDPSGYMKCDDKGNVHEGTGEVKSEVYYRTMSEKHYKRLEKTNIMPGTGETFISPTKEYAALYEGVLVRFELDPGTTAKLEEIGLKNDSPITNVRYPEMKDISSVSKWNEKYAHFKGEGLSGKKGIGKPQVNIGLGKGTALGIFNDHITSFERTEK